MTLDDYLDQVFIHEDDVLKAVKADIVNRGMPAIFVPVITGAALAWLIRAHEKKQALEIGALGGYSGIWMGRALGADGHLTSLELQPEYRDVAYANMARAGLADRVSYWVGPATESLAKLKKEGRRFDFFFIDADKENYPAYLEYALALAMPGAIIAADNTLQGGLVANPDEASARVDAIRTFNRQSANHPKLMTLLLPIGDGLTITQYQP